MGVDGYVWAQFGYKLFPVLVTISTFLCTIAGKPFIFQEKRSAQDFALISKLSVSQQNLKMHKETQQGGQIFDILQIASTTLSLHCFAGRGKL